MAMLSDTGTAIASCMGCSSHGPHAASALHGRCTAESIPFANRSKRGFGDAALSFNFL